MKRRISLALLAFLIASTGAFGHSIPSDVVARLIADGEQYVRAINDDSLADRTRVVEKIFSAQTLASPGTEKLIGQLSRLAESFAPLEYHHTEVVGSSLHVYARSKNSNHWQDFQFRIETQPPYKLQQLVFVAEVAEPVYLPNGGIEQPQTIEWLNGYIDKLIAENDLSGSVLIGRGDQALYERSFGFADAARKRPVTGDTRLNLGSGNKMFTAVAITLLESQGKLSYDDTLGMYFPDFPDREFAHTATIRHLLSHTSGLGDYWTKDYERHWDKITRLDEILPFVYSDSIYFKPGSDFQYSNSGFLLAGLIVEKVSGQDYFDFVREHIYKPLGMSNSDSYLRSDTTANLAEALARDGKGWKAAQLGIRGSSAGGGYSTPRDMLRFVRGFNAGSLLDRGHVTPMLMQSHVDKEAPFGYGYGFMLWQSQGGMRSFGHGGIAPGVNFEVRYYPEEDITFVIFSNQDNGAYDDLRKNIVKLITGDR